MDSTTWTSAGLVVTMTVLIGLLRFERDGHSRRSCPPLAAERVETVYYTSVRENWIEGNLVPARGTAVQAYRRRAWHSWLFSASTAPRPSLRRVANTGPTCFYDVDRGNCGP